MLNKSIYVLTFYQMCRSNYCRKQTVKPKIMTHLSKFPGENAKIHEGFLGELRLENEIESFTTTIKQNDKELVII